jgi:hypothetical protein
MFYVFPPEPHFHSAFTEVRLISGFAVLTCAEAIVRRLLSQNNVTIGFQLWE